MKIFQPFNSTSFDEELTVQKRLENIQLIENGEEITNYHLLNPMKIDIFKFRICLSDFLESYFSFLDENSLQEIVRYRTTISEIQAENFKKVYNLIERSDRHNKLLLKNSNSARNINERIIKLKLLAGVEV